MLIIRCTRKLLVHVGPPATTYAYSTTRLGDFPAALAAVLRALDLPRAAIVSEIAETHPAVITTTDSRSLLGTLTDFSFMLKVSSGSIPRRISSTPPSGWPVRRPDRSSARRRSA